MRDIKSSRGFHGFPHQGHRVHWPGQPRILWCCLNAKQRMEQSKRMYLGKMGVRMTLNIILGSNRLSCRFLLCSHSLGTVSLGLCWLRVGWCSKPPNLCSLYAEAHLGATQCHKLLQVGPYRHHLFLRRYLGGDSHQGWNTLNFSCFPQEQEQHLQKKGTDL